MEVEADEEDNGGEGEGFIREREGANLRERMEGGT